MKARRGKIARLPREVREELNLRLDDGQDGPTLLAWLNDHPVAQQVMRRHFGGAGVNKFNLSAWRRGGFVEWQRHQDALSRAERVLEEAGDFEGLTPCTALADRLAALMAVALAQVLDEALRSPPGPERTRTILAAARELTRLRRAERDRERSDREQDKWDHLRVLKYGRLIPDAPRDAAKDECRMMNDEPEHSVEPGRGKLSLARDASAPRDAANSECRMQSDERPAPNPGTLGGDETLPAREAGADAPRDAAKDECRMMNDEPGHPVEPSRGKLRFAQDASAPREAASSECRMQSDARPAPNPGTMRRWDAASKRGRNGCAARRG